MIHVPRRNRLRHLLAACGLAACAAFAPGAVAQQTLTIVTSFPKELTAAYKKAFEAANPGVKAEILNRGTSSGIAYVREAPANNKPDIFWASAPDAFEVLAGANLPSLIKLIDIRTKLPLEQAVKEAIEAGRKYMRAGSADLS